MALFGNPSQFLLPLLILLISKHTPLLLVRVDGLIELKALTGENIIFSRFYSVWSSSPKFISHTRYGMVSYLLHQYVFSFFHSQWIPLSLNINALVNASAHDSFWNELNIDVRLSDVFLCASSLGHGRILTSLRTRRKQTFYPIPSTLLLQHG